LRRLLKDFTCVADDEEAGRATAFFLDGCGDVFERGADDALVWAGGTLDDCAGC